MKTTEEKINLLFLDTETTSLEEGRLVQLAAKSTRHKKTVNQLFKPPKPIEIGAMAVNHITNKMVEGAAPFDGSEEKKALEKILETHVLVAHNAPFDIGILKNEGVETKFYICTRRVAMHVLESEQYHLQYLRYFLGFEFEEQINPHDAFSDILVLEKLYYWLENKVIEMFSLKTRKEAVVKMLTLSKKPVILKAIKFGKYVGKTFEEIKKMDKGYLDWLRGQEFVKNDIDLSYTLAALR